jgi:protein phosphatase
MKVSCAFFGVTHQGLVRSNNEDAWAIALKELGQAWAQMGNYASKAIALDGLGAVMAVADGMGGTNAGEVAAQIAIETTIQGIKKLSKVPLFEDEAVSILKKFVYQAHYDMEIATGQNPNLQGMGTTLVIGWILGSRLHLVWSGDSRCYVHRKGQGLLLLTEDHSYVQELVNAGDITPEEAWGHPHANIITQCLGDAKAPKPSSRSFSLKEGDLVMLCSDGLNSMLPDAVIAEYFVGKRDVEQISRNLVKATNEAGGADNITIAMAYVAHIEEPPPASGKNANKWTIW